jgi:hypothetical protein
MYAVICCDRPDSAALRDTHRAAHSVRAFKQVFPRQ